MARREGLTARLGGSYSALIREILYDGKAHYDAEIMAHMARKIPPEIAMRVKSKRTTGNLMDQVISGIRRITHDALAGQEKQGLVAKERDEKGRLMWRLTDPDYLAVVQAVQEHRDAEQRAKDALKGGGA